MARRRLRGKATFASDYFDFMYRCAEHLVSSGNAYVDSQSADEMRHSRGTFTEAGTNSPFEAVLPTKTSIC